MAVHWNSFRVRTGGRGGAWNTFRAPLTVQHIWECQTSLVLDFWCQTQIQEYQYHTRTECPKHILYVKNNFEGIICSYLECITIAANLRGKVLGVSRERVSQCKGRSARQGGLLEGEGVSSTTVSTGNPPYLTILASFSTLRTIQRKPYIAPRKLLVQCGWRRGPYQTFLFKPVLLELVSEVQVSPPDGNFPESRRRMCTITERQFPDYGVRSLPIYFYRTRGILFWRRIKAGDT